jgi:hypothetical protein
MQFHLTEGSEEMKLKCTVLIYLFFLCFESLATTKSEFIEVSIDSKLTKQNLNFRVSLPQGYENAPNKFYPLFITTSGQSRLDNVVAQVKWLSHVDFAPIPQAIIITIPDIKYENKDKLTAAAGQENVTLSSVLREEILPYIDNTYRTTGYRIIEGFSSFGNFPLYMLRHHSDMINAFFIFSPALGLDKSGLVNSLSEDWQPSDERQHYVFLSLGSFIDNRVHFEHAKQALNKLKTIKNFQVDFADYSKDNYLSGPNIGLIKASQLAFADLQPDYQVFHEAGEVALKHYFKQLNNKYGEVIDVRSKLIDLSFSYAEHGKFSQAISLMKRIVAKEPTDYLLSVRLAQVQIKAEQRLAAKTSLNNAYELAIKVNNEEAKTYIKNMLANLG